MNTTNNSKTSTTAQYVVAGQPIPGYEIIRQLPYSQWLQTGPSSVYLQKIPDINKKLFGSGG